MITRKAASLLARSSPSPLISSSSSVATICWRCRVSSRPLAVFPRYFHNSTSNYATPLPLGGTAAGPPPAAPVPQSEYVTKNRLRQAAVPKPRTERFWEDVHLKLIDDRFQILLDTRPIKTASKRTLSIPANKPHLAHAIQVEWAIMRTSKEALKPHYIPLTSLTSRAIDLEMDEKEGKLPEPVAEGEEEVKGTRDQILDFVMGYLDTDTLLMISPTRGGHLAGKGEKQLRDRQLEAANDMVEWAQENIPATDGQGHLEFELSDGDHGLLPTSQSDRTRDAIKDLVSKFTPWELVGLECAVIISKSLLVGLRLVMENRKGGSLKWDVEDAATACNLETDFQIEQWGLVEDTHDVNHADLRRGLGSVVMLVSEIEFPDPSPQK
ncbi:ATP synthase complex assembly protein atp12 [Orbilia ellipsospora]|uniref:ATP synthase complex assembly protein atp12 n=1 Tax=Orbilia ellipsospora TaxID=2528407 RepID=A0AAV9XAN6_9PEZI